MVKHENEGRKRKGRRRLLILIPFIVMLTVFLAMQHSTDALIQEIHEACLSDDYYVNEQYLQAFPERYQKPGIEYIPCTYEDRMSDVKAYFNFRHNVELSGKGDFHEFIIEVKVTRKLAWHNFRKGYLWITYTRAARTKEEKIVTGSWDIPVKLIIEWKDGKWVPTKIYEDP